MPAPKLFTRFTATLAATLCMAAATPAFAGEFESNGRQSEVRYGDLDLTKPDGKKVLRQRINHAASKVCRTNDRSTFQACRATTLRNIKAPVQAAVARAETNARYAAAGDTRVVVGN